MSAPDDGFKPILNKRAKSALKFASKVGEETGRDVRVITTNSSVPNRVDPVTAELSGVFYRRKTGLSGVTVGGEAVHQHGFDAPHQKPADGAEGRNRRLSNASWDALSERTGFIGKRGT
ncbi:MAG: hypothetical protein KF778_07795 [Rhodocyclaceae bacterium]|nr:hypothetical protein [Rhodocyclaceae bacterium]MBX3668292.1 hypothetical protein [Rhodocyclaceae bacterium]